ncbi:class I SAM-dependent methyltransferase [Spirosoma rhododendri]|uniref:Methyltransferase domain-containing protein n=1 Tax=Spirosoma rhododendri TaxID=2728024 RepID=A0A7L5DTU9_9BACT|nr:class I SAM-dependent methyltransferase [Spirosoma rhododendri]QJD80018.1 methyltransferase domain-containing protein [Spirosoma rhododendri]
MPSLPPTYFDDVYRANEDPWSFETSEYERGKYEATLAALPEPRYASAFEIGCSIGVLTRQLADRCDQLLAVDASELPLTKARQRLADKANVRIERMAIPATFPDGPFDLILVSEVGYYLSENDLARARQRMIDTLKPGGDLLLVHWTPFVPDYPLTGDAVHDFFLQAAAADGPLEHRLGQRADTYRLDLFRKR